jgi:hypothetical protein
MINQYLKVVLLLVTMTLFSCGGGGDDKGTGGGGGEPDVIVPPTASTLISPIKNEECNQGNVISAAESTVTFEWNKSENTNSYTIVLKNLETNAEAETTTNALKVSITLLRGVAYSWKIISKGSKTTTTATSETWNLYNAGEGAQNYAPFPAGLVSPAMGSTASTTVTLNWAGSDLDNDITSYDVYLDTANPPTLLKETTTNMTINSGALTANTVYYWKVVTKDGNGNNSQSPNFEFKTE